MARTAGWVMVVALLLGGCDGGTDSSAEESTSSSTSTTAASDREAEEQAVIDAYLAELDAFYAAANPPDPDHPALAETATGPLLENLRKNLADLAAQGVAIRKGEGTTNDPQVVRLSPTTAVVKDCSTDADVKFEIDTGEIVDDTVVYGRLTARLVNRAEHWLVESKTVEELEKPCG